MIIRGNGINIIMIRDMCDYTWKGYQYHYDQICVIIRGKGRQVKATSTLILT